MTASSVPRTNGPWKMLPFALLLIALLLNGRYKMLYTEGIHSQGSNNCGFEGTGRAGGGVGLKWSSVYLYGQLNPDFNPTTILVTGM